MIAVYKITETEAYNLEEDWTAVWEFLSGDIVKCTNESFKSGEIGIVAKSLPKRQIPKKWLGELQTFRV
jgi:hypothetical protein